MILFWPPIAEPLYRYMRGDEEYLHSYTKGFSTLPTPSQVTSRDHYSCSMVLSRETGSSSWGRVLGSYTDDRVVYLL